ncbi:hypothetical protein [Actinobaculum suis]|uniref:hypothetical protein n=1 Tax=Actinobaculum suis TaxID=1657 RepID=UPI0011478E9C|nr:hypothetical protein [Actinobaculum suis]
MLIAKFSLSVRPVNVIRSHQYGVFWSFVNNHHIGKVVRRNQIPPSIAHPTGTDPPFYSFFFWPIRIEPIDNYADPADSPTPFNVNLTRQFITGAGTNHVPENCMSSLDLRMPPKSKLSPRRSPHYRSMSKRF